MLFRVLSCPPCIDLIVVVQRFKKSRTIAPLHTGGPVAVTEDGTRLISCVGEEAILTDLEAGIEICRFVGVCYLVLHIFL